MRRMVAAYGDRASGQQQQVKDVIAKAVAWLGRMCHSLVMGVHRLRSDAKLSGAELRMQLSAAATVLKHWGLAGKAAQPFTSLVMLSLLAPSRDAASAPDSMPHHLHFISLYFAGLQNPQTVMNWGPSLHPSGGFRCYPSTEDARIMVSTILNLHGVIQARLFRLAPAVGLGALALSVMTTGPVWDMFTVAAAVGLPSREWLQSCPGSDAVIYHLGITRAIDFIDEASAFSRLLSGAAVLGEVTSLEGLLSRQGSTALGNGEGPAAPEGLPSREQRSSILACVTAVHALLHSEALGCLVGQLWHVSVEPRQLPSSDSCGSFEQQPGAASSCGDGSSSSSGGEEGCTVGRRVVAVFSDLRSVMEHAFDLASRCRPQVMEGDDSGSSSVTALGLKLQGISLAGLEGVDITPVSFSDVPTRAQSEVMEQAGLSMLSQLRSLATELLTMSTAALAHPEQPDTSAVAVQGNVGTSWSRWEVLQAALFRSLPPEQQEDWGRPLWCCNPGCTNLSGPSELQLKTYACGGGCGVRYCSRECQVQGWRLGHRHSCAEIVVGQD